MKRGILRFIVYGLVAASWCMYLRWDYDRLHDGRKVQHINCVNNLKQIGLAIKIWEGDNGEKYPFQISTNSGGTLELCDRDKNGFDRNSLAHFVVMSNELGTPLLLCCPKDHSKRPLRGSENWGKLTVSNISYQMRTDFKISLDVPHEILVVCPIDGNILYCDGTVTDKNGKTPEMDDN